MGLLRTILILLLVYYVLKILTKFFGPKLFHYAARKTEKRFREQFEQFARQHPPKEDHIGDIIIENSPAKKAKTSKKVGDYIDFEELE